jgi:hypothetical protein
MNIAECLKYIHNNLSFPEILLYKSTGRDSIYKFHNSFGRWVRNSCGFWDETQDTQETIKNECLKLNTSPIKIDLFEDLKEHNFETSPIDYSLGHPDNLSGIVLEIYHILLNDDYDWSHNPGQYVIELDPWLGEHYIGDDIAEWLIDNDGTPLIHPLADLYGTLRFTKRFLFESEEQAVHFKLRWGGELISSPDIFVR